MGVKTEASAARQSVAERSRGYRPDEIIGAHFSRFSTEDEAGRYEEEGWRVRKDGTTFWASLRESHQDAVLVARRGDDDVHGVADLLERRYADQLEEGFWRIVVSDDGIGIPPAEQERIFDRFHRLHPRDAYSGTGLGLALTQRLVDRHGGRLGVDSTPGERSRFWFTLPTGQSS